MFTRRERELFFESAKQATRWYIRNQNTDEHPWGGIANSADKGRFVYEYYPARKAGRGAGIWAQALGIMALDAVSIRTEREDPEEEDRRRAAIAAGEYMLLLQHTDRSRPNNLGGFSEAVPGLNHSYPRDAITGGLGLCALHRITGEERYLESARLFSDWYRNRALDKEGWPHIDYDFKLERGFLNKCEVYRDMQGHNRRVKGDWQAGGSLFFAQLADQTGDRALVDEVMVPLMDRLLALYEKHPVTDVVEGFHGFHPVSFGNDDFALVSLLCAYCATGKEQYYVTARDRILGLLPIMDETGGFPSHAGTFVMGITIKVLMDLQAALGLDVEPRLAEALKKAAHYGLGLQACDYNDIRVHGGFWGQSSYGVSRDRIHHRSTGYAAILYAMLVGEDNPIPYYHCLNWGYSPGPV